MIEQELVEAYFECNGFLVRQVGNYASQDSRRKLDPLPMFAVMNPKVPQNSLGSGMRLFSGDLNKIHNAVVGVIGWSNSSFSPAVMSSDLRLVKFLKQQITRDRIDDCFISDPQSFDSLVPSSLRLLVVPALPMNVDKMKIAVEYIETQGVDGLLTLRSLLENLLRQNLPAQGRGGRSILQLLRLLKSYGLSSDPQMEIFRDSE